MLTNIRAAARSLRRRPFAGFVAALSLGIGMSLATSVFAMLQELVLRAPFPDARNVVQIYHAHTGFTHEAALVPARHLLAARASGRPVSNVAGGRPAPRVILGASGAAGTVPALAVTTNFFDLLRVRPILGRSFREADAAPGATPAIVIGYSLWQSRFGGNANILDHAIVVNGRPASVVGVMPKGFEYPFGARLWLPLSDEDLRAVAAHAESDWPRYLALGRVNDGSHATAEPELQHILDRADVAASVKDSPRVRLLSVPAAIRRDNATEVSLWVALSVVIVLLCGVNFATVSLARGMRRRPEIAVRSALGASARQLIGMFLAEATLVGAIGGIIAILIAIWLSGVVRLSAAVTVSTLLVDWRGVLFGITGTVVAGLLFALAPSVQLSRADLRTYLSAESAVTDGRGAVTRDRTALIALQLALAVICVSAVMALVRADRRFDGLGPGYDFRRVLTAKLLVTDSASRASLERPLLEFIRGRPAVEAASLQLLPIGPSGVVGLATDSEPSRDAGLHWADVAPDFFSTLKVRPTRGRLPMQDEIVARAPVAVLSEFVVRNTFGRNVNPVGRRIRMKASGQRPIWLTVVGVVPDVRRGPDFWMPEPPIYTALSMPLNYAETRLFIRVAGDPATSLGALQRALATYDPRVVVFDLRMVRAEVAQFTARSRARRAFLVSIAVLSLVLAAVGVYGLSSYTAATRVKEICIRLALGAGTADVIRVALGQLLAMAFVGSALGVLAAPRFAEILDAAVRDVRQDFLPVVTFPMIPAFIATGALLAVAFAGAYLPLRRVLRRQIAEGLR